MHANVDQIGLAVFYRLRRVELIIKQALVDLDEEPLDVANLGHSLEQLWRSLGTLVRVNGYEQWRTLADDHGRLRVGYPPGRCGLVQLPSRGPPRT